MRYIIRLDDACEKMDNEKWYRMECILDRYQIKPLVGVIPHCDSHAMEQYQIDLKFWEKVCEWRKKGWVIALHGYNHVYSTSCGGINPVQPRSEFAGESLSVQKEKLSSGINIFRKHGIDPLVFVAPSHTFDINTLIALKECSNIRVISDTVANDIYSYEGLTFVPQQAGNVRMLPLKTVTFCYHPNTMSEKSFETLECFLARYSGLFIEFPVEQTDRKRSLFDRLLRWGYFTLRKIKRQ